MPRRHLRLLVFLALIGAVSIGTAVTLAASRQHALHPARAVPALSVAPLVVPDVRGQVYVYAKGILEDAGFGFRVEGSVPGYAANHVAAQVPAPGTKVVDTGAPMVTLRLAGSSGAAQGQPQNAAPYPSTALRLFRRTALASRAVPKAAAKKTAPAVAPAKQAQTRQAKSTKATPTRGTKQVATRRRPPAFAVPGAPREPLDEIPLVWRAQRLDRWVASQPAYTSANVNYWLYQHAWIVTGARFGWWQGDKALEVLITTDRRVESEWGVGALSLQQARAALADVQARMRAR